MVPVLRVRCLISFAAIGAAAFLFDDDSDGGNEDTDTGDTYDVSGGDTITGSEGDDVFLADIDAGTYENVSIDAGAGDDTLAFFDPEAEDDPTNTVAEFYQATINAGAGNDLIDIFASSSEIQGSDGDDTISVYGVP